MCSGRSFQSCGEATAKALDPYTVRLQIIAGRVKTERCR